MPKKKVHFFRIKKYLKGRKTKATLEQIAKAIDLSEGYTRKLLNQLGKTGDVYKHRFGREIKYSLFPPKIKELYIEAHKQGLLDEFDFEQSKELLDRGWPMEEILDHWATGTRERREKYAKRFMD